MCLCDTCASGGNCPYHGPQSLTWATPDEPGREVTAVRDHYERRWVHEHERAPGDIWVLYAPDGQPLDGRWWRNLLHEHGPLTDATGEA